MGGKGACQSTSAAILLLLVSVLLQEFNDRLVGGNVYGGLTLIVQDIDLSTLGEQHFNDRGVSRPGCAVKRRLAVLILHYRKHFLSRTALFGAVFGAVYPSLVTYSTTPPTPRHQLQSNFVQG